MCKRASSVLTAAVFLAVGCGGQPAPPPAQPAVASAGASAEEQGASRPEDAPGSEPEPEVTAEGCGESGAACLEAAQTAVGAEDRAGALAALHGACRARRDRVFPRCTGVGAEVPVDSSVGAGRLALLACQRCSREQAPSCPLGALLARSLPALETSCADGQDEDCATHSWAHLLGCGVDVDVQEAARFVERVPAGLLERLYRTDAVVPTPAGLEPMPARPPARMRRSGSVGLPALSSDGRVLAIVEEAGSARWDSTSLLVLHVADGTRERTYPISSSTLAEDAEQTAAETAAARREARENLSRADRFLVRRGFRGLVPLQVFDEEAPTSAALVLVAARLREELLVRDVGPGAIRWRGLAPGMPVPAAPPEPEYESEAWHEWEEEYSCWAMSPESVDGWWDPDSDRVLLRAIYNPAGDSCAREHVYEILELVQAPQATTN